MISYVLRNKRIIFEGFIGTYRRGLRVDFEVAPARVDEQAVASEGAKAVEEVSAVELAHGQRTEGVQVCSDPHRQGRSVENGNFRRGSSSRGPSGGTDPS